MKTKFIAFLAIASLSAYTYLTMVPTQNLTPKNIYGVGNDAPEEQEIYLPDVEMVNKIIEAGKKLKSFGL
ncbi:MAG: hypothetical protein AAGJ18_28300 [Bacteroidota bacterium]